MIGVIVYIPLQTINWYYYMAVVAVMFLFGIWLCGQSAGKLGVHDHPGIVWDEIVGYLTTMILAPAGWTWIMAGFLLFRIFDIWKPWPVRWVDKKVQGGLGIMIDDVLAAIYSMILIQIIAYLL